MRRAVSPLTTHLKKTMPAFTTQNGAVTEGSTQNLLLDLFFVAGASRNVSENDLYLLLSKAFAYDFISTAKIVFYMRDIREGAGERRFFRVARDFLAKHYPSSMKAFNVLTPIYGRWDDLWKDGNDLVMNSAVESLALFLSQKEIPDEDKNALGLLCKWLPRKGKFASLLRKKLKWTHKKYRKFLVRNSSTVEQKMSAKLWDSIEYKSVPSIAFNNYKKAFARNDSERFSEFIQELIDGKTKVNAKTLFPHQIAAQCMGSYSINDINLLQAQWDNLNQYTAVGSVLPIVDVSGSMSSLLGGTSYTILNASIGLGIYLSEKIEGPFKDYIISFSGRPRLHKLEGNIANKVRLAKASGEDMNTNLQGVFEVLLDTAVREKVSDKDMPQTLIVLSDMEFDSCGRRTNFEAIKDQYIKAGYQMPKLVFWNLNGRLNNYPTQSNIPNVVLLSGYSPSLMKMAMSNSLDPLSAMMEAINSERYEFIGKLFSIASD